MGCQLGDEEEDDEGVIIIPCINKEDFITEQSGDDENGLSDTLSISSTTSSRSEANTPDLHDADYLQETTESENAQDDALNSSLFNLGKNTLGLDTDLSDCLHQHINN